MSLPLLLARKTPGRGPLVPVKDHYTHLRVEGLADGQVLVDVGDHRVQVQTNGCYELHRPTSKGFSAQAELMGVGEVHVTLEKHDGRSNAPQLQG